MGESVREYFGAIAHAYDARALRAQPRYQEMLAQVVASLPEEASNVLEMGCGTGALTVLVAKHYPAARLTAVDAAPEMIELARTRLSAEGLYPDARIQFARTAFEDLQIPEHAFDLVTSNMSLHHVIDKERLYASLRIGLRPRGFLVFGDELTGALPYVEERHWNGWLNFSRLPGHLTEEEIADIVRHAEQLDHYETLPRQLDLLRAAGFDPVDCVWRYLNYGIFAGQA
jgi:ubiquinone/menaquinone biosynthesis C-methylase UbiE